MFIQVIVSNDGKQELVGTHNFGELSRRSMLLDGRGGYVS